MDERARVLRERAQKLAKPVEAQPERAGRELLVLTVATCRCGVDVRSVHSVHEPVRWTAVPAVAPEWLGVVTLRARLYPLLDLGRLLNVTPQPRAPESVQTSRIVLVSAGETVALRTDETPYVLTVDADTLLPPLPGSPAVIEAVTPGLVSVLDADAICAAAMLAWRRRHQALDVDASVASEPTGTRVGRQT